MRATNLSIVDSKHEVNAPSPCLLSSLFPFDIEASHSLPVGGAPAGALCTLPCWGADSWLVVDARTSCLLPVSSVLSDAMPVVLAAFTLAELLALDVVGPVEEPLLELEVVGAPGDASSGDASSGDASSGDASPGDAPPGDASLALVVGALVPPVEQVVGAHVDVESWVG